MQNDKLTGFYGKHCISFSLTVAELNQKNQALTSLQPCQPVLEADLAQAYHQPAPQHLKGQPYRLFFQILILECCDRPNRNPDPKFSPNQADLSMS
jgi:hypothetical protein